MQTHIVLKDICKRTVRVFVPLQMLGEERKRIYRWDSTMEVMERDTPLYGRMNVSRTGLSGEVEVLLTIRDVQLGDETDYVCDVKSLTDGSDTGRTRLRVFGMTMGSD